MWAIRIVHESTLHENNCFVTFTYRSKEECTEQQYEDGYYVPEDYSLNYHHFRDFMKRLRKHFPQKIRYFHCGEYGDDNLRPHYHACLFNVEFDDVIVEQQEQGITIFSSPSLSKLWPWGFCTIGELNYQTAAYTAGYILKKITGHEALDAYLRSDENGVAFWVKPPYTTMSLKPGIGREFYEKYKNDFFPSDESPVPGKGIVQKVPRYYTDILKSEDPAQMAVVTELRAAFIAAHRADFTPERLKDKYKYHQAKQSLRHRNL